MTRKTQNDKFREYFLKLNISVEDIKMLLDRYENKNFLTKYKQIFKYVEETLDDHELDFVRRVIKYEDIGNKVTFERMTLKYGMKDGTKRFQKYCDRQSETNTYEYKKKKYAWTKEQFKEYNQSRAVTLDNMTKKYGEELGKIKFESYCERQAYTNTIDYFIEVYGEKKGTERYNEVCEQKSHNIDAYIERFGEAEGTVKYIEFLENRGNPFFSKVSQELFWSIYDKLPEDIQNKCYFAELNKEFCKYDTENRRPYFYDFVVSCSNFVIEYNGVHWHAHPDLYDETDTDHKIKGAPQKVSDIWEFDKIKNDCITSLGFELMVVWENETPDINEIVDIIIKRYEENKTNSRF